MFSYAFSCLFFHGLGKKKTLGNPQSYAIFFSKENLMEYLINNLINQLISVT